MLKRTVPVAIAFVVGLWFVIQYFVPAGWSQQSLTDATNWAKILLGFAYILGLYSLVHVHWLRIRRRQPGYGYSLLVYLGLGVTVALGMVGEVEKAWNLLAGGSASFADFQTYGGPNWTSGVDWIYTYVLYPASATMFSILAFFIASAAYRTFRARTLEAALLLVAAAIVMFGRVPLSAAIDQAIPQFADWIMAYPNMAVKRAILIGVTLGMVATSLRIIFGIERAYLGGD
ncbi:MAG: hypothetical protein KatS3mg102_2796 [Planctomycetota bacterium]|nr:MAG: hypothetical protein KatS3mg102_2796 [Planctomycetota bacterium]